MIVSSSKKFIFIHVPRTGGSSFTWNYRRYFDRYDPNIRTVKGFQGYFHQGGMHSTYLKHKEFMDKSNFFKFAFVRNPYDWMFSWYTVLNPHQEPTKKSFEAFVKSPNITHRHLIEIPQTAYIYDKDGNLGVDFIGRYEYYYISLRFIEKTLGIGPMDTEHLNRSPYNHDYRHYYTDEARAMVAERYKEDIRVLNYDYYDQADT